MTDLYKPGSVRNYVLATFLKNYKRIEPYYFWPNDKFYKKFEYDLKAILDWDRSIIVICSEGGGTTPYGGPFTLKSEDRIYGWALGSLVPNKPIIYSLYVAKEKQGQGYARRMIELLYNNLKQPTEVQMVWPTRQTFNAVRSILRGRARIFVDLE